eukprot:jgi/Undpi1/12739/HiC_scaffold_6.g02407.m1
MAKPHVGLALAVVVAFCGSADAFVIGAPGGSGRVAAGRTRASTTSSSFTPLCYGKPCAGAVAARGASPANGRSTMVVSPLLSVTPAWRDGNPEGRRWGIGDRSDVAGRGRAAGQGALEGVGGEGGDERGGGGSVKEGCLGGLRPAAVLRFVRQSVGRCSGNTGVGARIAAWRRRASVAFIGVAAAFMVMSASAGPAQAFPGRGGGAVADATPQRLTRMPEHIYQQREQLQEFCQAKSDERLFDLNDLTSYEEELDKLDMFGDKIAVKYGTRESMRIKYSGYLADYKDGGRHRGFLGTGRLLIFGSALLTGEGVYLVVGCLGSVAWVFTSFLKMAREEEVHLYGEEISVDATEKDDDELEGLDDIDDDDLEDYAKSPTPGDDPDPSPSSPSPSSDVGGGGGGDAGGGGGGDEDGDGDDDLLGM